MAAGVRIDRLQRPMPRARNWIKAVRNRDWVLHGKKNRTILVEVQNARSVLQCKGKRGRSRLRQCGIESSKGGGKDIISVPCTCWPRDRGAVVGTDGQTLTTWGKDKPLSASQCEATAWQEPGKASEVRTGHQSNTPLQEWRTKTFNKLRKLCKHRNVLG
jgi:hypothetical protein